MSDLASTAFGIVMVGHSLFGTTGPDMLDAALSATSTSVQVQEQIINGAPLKYNWDRSDEAQGIDAQRLLCPEGQGGQLLAYEDEQAGGHRDQHMRPQTRRLALDLALGADHRAKHKRRDKPRRRDDRGHGAERAGKFVDDDVPHAEARPLFAPQFAAARSMRPRDDARPAT